MPKRVLRIHAIPLSDDDGGRAFNFTAKDLADLIKRANQRFQAASIELAFDPQHDWRPRRSTALNNLQNSGSKWFEPGNAVAARIPGKIVLFFRHGPGTSPTGNGHAYPPDIGKPVPPSVKLPTANVNYVALPNTKNGINQNDGNFFCHELGHYLGLFHTFPGWGSGEVYGNNAGSLTGTQAVQALVRYLRNNGGPAAMNGDLLADTARDCGNVVYSAQGLSEGPAGPASLNLKGNLDGQPYDFTFTPPRNNIMSYFRWGSAQVFTPQQIQRMHLTLAHAHRRILIEPPCFPDFHGLDASKFQLCFDYWVNRGLWPHTLSANAVSSKTIMAGSFQAGKDRPVRHLVSGAAYQKAFEQFRAQSFRPGRVTATTTAAGVRYTAIWTPIDGQFEARHSLTLAQFDAMWHDLRKKGFLHADLNVYATSGGIRVAAVWVKKPFTDYACYYGMTATEYQQRFKDFWNKGLRVTCFCAYRVGSAYRYAAIWEKVPGAWGHWFGLDTAGYQAKYNEMAKSGHRLHQVQSYGQRYSGVWTKP
jgi:Bacterial tandem repeat domain 1